MEGGGDSATIVISSGLVRAEHAERDRPRAEASAPKASNRRFNIGARLAQLEDSRAVSKRIGAALPNVRARADRLPVTRDTGWEAP